MTETTSTDHLEAPVDATSHERLAQTGLDYTIIRASDDGFSRWHEAMGRAFLDPEATDEQIEAARERSHDLRLTAVYDPSGAITGDPVGTLASWIAELSLPGGAVVNSCLISDVTVAATHHRRGIARAMLEGELRTAAAVGVPLASLTVSEATLYGRYGFAPAVFEEIWDIDTKRATWIGPTPRGRVDHISRARLRELLPELHEQVRRDWPGEVAVIPGRWDWISATRPGADNPGGLRAVQYTDADGTITGVAAYRATFNDDDYAKSSVSVKHVLATTDDAYAGLWRHILALDLIGTVNADRRRADEPLRWMVGDQRAIVSRAKDHHHLRILDVVAVLESRSYAAPGTFVLDVADPLDITTGRYALTIDANGRGSVTRVAADAPVAGAVAVSLGIAELSALILGGASAAALAAAGRLTSEDVDAAARLFAWHRAPRLSMGY